VAEQLRQEISRLMLTEMKDPRVRMASISQVKLSPDLRSARVMVSAVGSDEERHAVVEGLRHATGYLRAELGHVLENLKVSPRLNFELDESIAYSVKVSTMLRELGVSDAQPEEEEEST
jgi:ribosome-binding factor A